VTCATRVSWVALLSCMILSHSVPAAASVEDLLRQAFVKESGEHNLEEAITLYKQITDIPGADAMIRFEARLRMGNCLEKLGKYGDASAVYEKILEDSSAPTSPLRQEVEENLRRLKTRQPS